ncbi:MAG: TIGR03009 domain-containing protein [Planctomycetales bacterium]|nr:TIGR03009 domain-containing protein [Planctomycetales bacterium]
MLRFTMLCGCSLLSTFCSVPLLAQPSSQSSQQQQARAQYQQAMQQQAAAAAQGSAQGAPVLVMDPATAAAAGVARVAQAPFEALNEEQMQYLQTVLNVWEQQTAKIERYQCNLTRWQYDPSIDDTAPATIDKGILKYSTPDKGLFRIDERQSIAKRGPPPEYRPSDKHGEYWICDGEYVHILDRDEKKANKLQLPPAMRGNGIHNSPLPFLFGVKANEIQQRYWIRPVKAPAGSSDVWLEAYPKRVDDAGNYSRVQVVLDANQVLPKALIVFMPNWEPQHPHREVYEFTERQSNWSFLSALKEGLFMKEFINTKLPGDWQVIVEPYIEPQEAGPAEQAAAQRVAQPPVAAPQRR